MESFQQKSIVTQRFLHYTYYVSPSSESTEKHPALFFIHGFPDAAHLWSDVVSELGNLPNQIIVPDCLGYAGTDKPKDTNMYTYNGQADDLVDILKNEKVQSAIIIGHDWGSALAQRTYLHHSRFFCGVILLNTGYMVPSDQPFDLAAFNQTTQKTLGYPQFSYWELVTAPDAAQVIEGHLERMWQVLHGDVEDWMKKMFCVPNAMREFLLGNEQVPLKSYARQQRWKDMFIQQFKRDGFDSALQMYRATASDIQLMSDSALLERSLKIEVPILFVICTQDAVCVPEMMNLAKNGGLVPHLREVVVESGHWSPMEKPAEIAAHIQDFVRNIFSG